MTKFLYAALIYIELTLISKETTGNRTEKCVK